MTSMRTPVRTDSALGRLRVKAGLTQKDAAQRLHVHQTLLSRWESGVMAATGPLVAKLASLYEVPVEAILGANRRDVERCARRMRESVAN